MRLRLQPYETVCQQASPQYLTLGSLLGLGELHNRFMAKGQVEELAQVTYGVTNRAADRTSPDRGK
jgi:hypothetical protein